MYVNENCMNQRTRNVSSVCLRGVEDNTEFAFMTNISILILTNIICVKPFLTPTSMSSRLNNLALIIGFFMYE